MMPSIISQDQPIKRVSVQSGRDLARGLRTRVALQIGGCTPCILGQMYCCEVSGFPPSLNCSHRSC